MEDWACATDSARYKKRLENDRVFEFLAGLSKSLDEVRSRILGRRPLPSLREVFSEIRREDGRRRVMLSDPVHVSADASALVSRHQNSASGLFSPGN